MPDARSPALRVILAGGRGSRLGGADKAFLDLDGRPLLAHAIARMGGADAISANGDPARFAGFGCPVLADADPHHPGPLAGILAGLDHAWAAGAPAIVTAAVDTPFAPPGLPQALAESARATGAAVVLVRAGGRPQPTFGLWTLAARPAVRAALDRGQGRIAAAAAEAGLAWFDHPDLAAFGNVNTPDDLADARARLSG